MKNCRILKLLITLCVGTFYIIACQTKGVKTDAPKLDVQELTKNQPERYGTEILEGELEFAVPLNQSLVTKGKIIYDVKCKSCHRLTDERLVGPGWAGVTRKRNATWIANMITNVDMMLEKDLEAQKLLEQCLIRMPNQNISKSEALELIEYMRHNDGEK